MPFFEPKPNPIDNILLCDRNLTSRAKLSTFNSAAEQISLFVRTSMRMITVCIIAVSCGLLHAEENRPNIIIINADDIGYGDFGIYGATKIKTPRIDQLANEGMRFTDAHSASAVCSPSRYALLTGEYPFRIDLWSPLVTRPLLKRKQLNLAFLMKEAGYATACIGKWHLGTGPGSVLERDWNKPLPGGPFDRGFDYFFGIADNHSSPPYVYHQNRHIVGYDAEDPLVRQGSKGLRRAKTEEIAEKGNPHFYVGADKAHSIYRHDQHGIKTTTKAVSWMKQQKGKPFFLYFPTINIHHPFTPAPRFVGTSDAGRYGDFVHELDWIVGEVVDALDEMGVTDNTLIILTSDNGAMLNLGGQDAWRAGHRLNGDLLGFKFGVWEGGHRVPFIVKWPGKVKPKRVCDHLISNLDVLATLAEVLERPLKADEGQDSKSLLPILLDPDHGPIRDELVLSPFQKKNIGIRKGDWVYISSRGDGGFGGREIGHPGLAGPYASRLTNQVNSDFENYNFKQDAPNEQLYNLKTDPSQKSNLVREKPELAKRLRERLAHYGFKP